MKCLSLLLAFVLALQSSAAAREMTTSSDGEENQNQETPQTTRLKAEIQKRSVGEKSRVRVRLRNGIELKGHISKIEDTFFEVTDQTGKPARIPYADAQKVRGPGMSKGAKIGIVAGVAVAVTAIVIAVGLKSAGY
jgi:small nuclear ribonucleoprotein (snRNP)-like protein